MLLRQALPLVLALVASQAARAQILPPDFSIPGPVLADVEVPAEVVVNGVRTRMKIGRSKWKVDELFRHYYKRFEEAHLYIPPEKAQMKVAKSLQITALDTALNITYTLVLRPLADGTTQVIWGSADFSKVLEEAKNVGDEIPLGPGASKPFRTRTEGLWSIAYETSAPPSATTKHYDEQLAQRGFKKVAEGRYENAKRQIKLTLTKNENGLGVVMLSEVSQAEAQSAEIH